MCDKCVDICDAVGILLKPATMTTKSGNPVVSVLITWFLVQVRQVCRCESVSVSVSLPNGCKNVSQQLK